MKRISKIFLLTVSIYLSFMFVFQITVNAKSINPNSTKILIIVNSLDEFDPSLADAFEGLYDVMSYNDMNYKGIQSYGAYAVPVEIAKSDIRLKNTLRKEYLKNDSIVYLYGKLTISDYKKALGIDKFGAYVNIYDEYNMIPNKAFMSFGSEQEDTYIENVISSSGSQTGEYIIASFANEIYIGTNADFITVSINNFCNTLIMPMATIVASGYDYRTYATPTAFINMDYLLYKDNAETDPNYDYFAVKSNVTAEGALCSSISTKHSLPYTSDEMIDYGPGDITNAGSISVSIGLGTDWGGGSLSYSFDVGGSPSIDATYSASSDYCNWDITRSYNGDLRDTLFILSSSWASTGTYAAVDVAFKGQFLYPSVAWSTVQIRYDY